MSGKLFCQIVILIIIAAIVMTVVKLGGKSLLYGEKGRTSYSKYKTVQPKK